MASPPPSQAEQARQAALTALLAAAMARAFQLIDINDLPGSLPRFRVAVTALVHKYGQASASLAARWYAGQRTAAGIPGRYVPIAADPAGAAQIRASLDWATKGLYSQTPDLPAVQTLTGGVAQKMVVDAARNTLIEAIQADKRCRGWARQARPDACAFCAMLSTRGAVYKSKESASLTSGTRGSRPAGLKYHDNCHCLPVPLFADRYEPPAYIRDWQALYRDSTRGLSGGAARNAFRVALERQRNPAPQPAAV